MRLAEVLPHDHAPILDKLVRENGLQTLGTEGTDRPRERPTRAGIGLPVSVVISMSVSFPPSIQSLQGNEIVPLIRKMPDDTLDRAAHLLRVRPQVVLSDDEGAAPQPQMAAPSRTKTRGASERRSRG